MHRYPPQNSSACYKISGQVNGFRPSQWRQVKGLTSSDRCDDLWCSSPCCYGMLEGFACRMMSGSLQNADISPIEHAGSMGRTDKLSSLWRITNLLTVVDDALRAAIQPQAASAQEPPFYHLLTSHDMWRRDLHETVGGCRRVYQCIMIILLILPLTDWKHRGKPTGRGGSSGSGVAVGHGWNCTRAASFAAPGFAGLTGHVFNPVVFAQGLGCGLLPPLGAPAHAGAGTGGTSQVDLRASFSSFTSTGLECIGFARSSAPGVFTGATSWQASCDGRAYTDKSTACNRFPVEGRDRVPLCCTRWRGSLDSSLAGFSCVAG